MSAMTYADHARVRKTLKRRKIGDRQYAIDHKPTGHVVAVVSMTGEWGRDDYPWDVLLTDESARGIGAQPTLTQCIDEIAARMLAREEEEADLADERTVAVQTIRALRQMAQDATSGTWEFGLEDSHLGTEWSIFMHDAGCDMALFEKEADARYATAMRPDVGVALADFLDEVVSLSAIHRESPSDALMALVRAIGVHGG